MDHIIYSRIGFWYVDEATHYLIFPGQNGRHLADDIFRCIFLKQKFCILIRIALKFVRNDSIDNKRALLQVMASRRKGDKAITRTNADPVHRRLYVALWWRWISWFIPQTLVVRSTNIKPQSYKTY